MSHSPDALPPRGDPTDRAQQEQRIADADADHAREDEHVAVQEQAIADAEQAEASDRSPLDERVVERAKLRLRLSYERERIGVARDRGAEERDHLAAERDVDADITDRIRARMQADELPPGHPLIDAAEAMRRRGSDARRWASDRRDEASADRRRRAQLRSAEVRQRQDQLLDRIAELARRDDSQP